MKRVTVKASLLDKIATKYKEAKVVVNKALAPKIKPWNPGYDDLKTFAAVNKLTFFTPSFVKTWNMNSITVTAFSLTAAASLQEILLVVTMLRKTNTIGSVFVAKPARLRGHKRELVGSVKTHFAGRPKVIQRILTRLGGEITVTGVIVITILAVFLAAWMLYARSKEPDSTSFTEGKTIKGGVNSFEPTKPRPNPPSGQGS